MKSKFVTKLMSILLAMCLLSACTIPVAANQPVSTIEIIDGNEITVTKYNDHIVTEMTKDGLFYSLYIDLETKDMLLSVTDSNDVTTTFDTTITGPGNTYPELVLTNIDTNETLVISELNDPTSGTIQPLGIGIALPLLLGDAIILFLIAAGLVTQLNNTTYIQFDFSWITTALNSRPDIHYFMATDIAGTVYVGNGLSDLEAIALFAAGQNLYAISDHYAVIVGSSLTGICSGPLQNDGHGGWLGGGLSHVHPLNNQTGFIESTVLCWFR